MTAREKHKYVRKIDRLIKKLAKKRHLLLEEIAADTYARRYGNTIESHSEHSDLLGTDYEGRETRELR